MLERMADFFGSRIDGYDEHMLNNIQSAHEFYSFTANNLPGHGNCCILDLGCGTGLELGFYFKLNPDAKITGIDLSTVMLDRLRQKFADKDIKLISASYFDVDFGNDLYDAAVSVESLHHFTKDEKIPLYAKLWASLKDDGYFILTDYFSQSVEEETLFADELKRIKKNENITDGELYHFDTPLTVEHEIEALISAGFKNVEVLNSWGATYTVKACK